MSHQTDTNEDVKVELPNAIGNEFIAPVVETELSPVIPEPKEIDFEHDQIQTLIQFIEFRLDEVNALITECVQRHFEFDPNADLRKVRTDCVGSRFQILYQNYHEGLKRLKAILMEMMRIKLQQLDDLYYDEVQYFMDLLEQIIDSDYLVMKTLEVAKRSSKYYSTPRLFEQVVGVVKSEIDTFDEIHQRFAAKRRKIQRNLESFLGTEEQPDDESSGRKKPKAEEWEWKEDDFPEMEPDTESSEETEEEHSEPHEDDHEDLSEDKDESHKESEDEEDHSDNNEQQSDEAEDEPEQPADEEPEPNEPEEEQQNDQEETAEVSKRPAKRRRAPKNAVFEIGDKFGKGISSTSDFAVNTVDKVLNSPAVLSFTQSLTSQLEGALKQNPGEQ